MAEQVCFFCGAPAGKANGNIGQTLECETCLRPICERCVVYSLDNLPRCEKCYFAHLRG